MSHRSEPTSEQLSAEHNIASLITQHAQREHPALIAPAGDTQVSISYPQLNAAAARVQQYLSEQGIVPGDRVALSMPNIPLMPALYYGIVASGALCVPVNPLLSGAELTHQLQDSGAKLLLAWEGTRLADEAPSTVPVRNGSVSVQIFSAEAFAQTGSLLAPFHESGAQLAPVAVEPSTPALILYTSGTTGRAKGATLTHANILSNARSCVDAFEFHAEDIVFGGLPLFHAFGQTVSMNAVFAVGATTALLPRFVPADALELLANARVSVLAAVPTMYLALITALEQNPDAARELQGQIRFGISGGAPLPASAHHALDSLIGCPIYEGYGLSETSPVVSFNQKKYGLKIGSVGRAIDGVQVQVRDMDGTVLEPGEAGQLWVGGECVMAGYWNNPQASEAVLDNGWFATGDVARLDEDGNIFIVDRIKDMVLRNGYSVYPREVEDILYTHPAVATAAVVGVPHEQHGEEVVAVIVLREGYDERIVQPALDALAREQLAAYKFPRRYIFVDAMPLGATGKILKKDLRAKLSEKE